MKHADEIVVDPELKQAILEKASDEGLPCAVAHEVAAQLGRTPEEVGRALDALNIRINKCQMGLFGYGERRRIVKRLEEVPDSLAAALHRGQINGRIPCATAWGIAAALDVTRLMVSHASETLGMKISRCQLGSFGCKSTPAGS